MKQANTTPSTSISLDKRAELEFIFIKDEMRARTEFNRRVHNIQFTLFGGIVVGTQIFSPDKLPASSYKTLCILALLVNYVLLHELTKNSYYVRAAAFYVVKVLNVKYGDTISEWEHYLGYLRLRSATFSDKYAFYMDTNIVLPVVIVTICAGLFISSIFADFHNLRHFRLPAFFIFLAVFSLNIYGVYDYVTGRSKLGRLFTTSDLTTFENKYKL